MESNSSVETTQNKAGEILGKGFLFTLGLFLAAAFLRRWISPVYAAALATFCLGLLVYLIPPRPNMSFGSWAVKVVQGTVLVLLAGLLYSFLGEK